MNTTQAVSCNSEQEYFSSLGFVFYGESDSAFYDFGKVVCQGKEDKTLSKDLDYRLKVIEGFVTLLPNINNWLRVSCEKRYLSYVELDFVLDFYKFATTGKRTISIQNWPDVLNLDLGRSDKANTQQLLAKVSEKGIKTPFKDTASLIIDWCSKPNGFDDMLWTLNALFKNDADSSYPKQINKSNFAFDFY